jgi:hypothetical protein
VSRPRTLVGLLLSASLAGLALVTLLAPTSCGSDAVGVDACRTIETARCNAATACGFADDKVQSCILFYRDQCLDGVENADAGAPATATIDACVAAVDATATCARAGAKTISGCAGAALVPGADTTLAPCVILQQKVDLLAACAFASLVPVADAGAAEAATDAQ